MVGMPAVCALSSTALPVPLSRLTIMRTLTPLVIIWSAMVWNAVLSPWAFWMSYWMPAALNASVRYLRSFVSHRAEDLLSGRMTPTFADLGAAPPLLPELGVELEPHAAVRAPVASSPTAVRERIPLRMCMGPFGYAPFAGTLGCAWG